MAPRIGRIRAAALAATALVLLAPVAVAAHPLGNYTINHYAGIRVRPAEVLLDVVIDMAEIPTFQERLAFDTDGDGEISDAEATAGSSSRCGDVAAGLRLEVGGARMSPTLLGSGVSFPPGVGGLQTMRLVCAYEAELAAPIEAITVLRFDDASFEERLGWREVVVEADGVTVDAPGLPATSPSARLTKYPPELLAVPLDHTEVSFTASPGGPAAAAWTVPEAGVGVAALPVRSPTSVPRGVGADVPAVFTADLNLGVAALALLTALLLGAGHAVTPGHGKTLIAAYLVGARGTAIHAVGLGLSVTLSHTLGILALAILVLAAQSWLPPDVVARALPVVAALSILGIGAWMVATELRRRRSADARHHEHDDDLDRHHDHEHEHEQVHSHGGLAHAHVAALPTTITWRSLFALGLAGGIIPSTNALLILLGTIAAGRAPFGIVLVVAFGLGMAAVLVGVGLALVYARGLVEQFERFGRLRAASSVAPLAASVFVLVLGVWLTGQAVLAPPTL